MDYKDYYRTLSVNKDSVTSEIKKSYRRLAKKYHPDKLKHDKASEKKFVEINEAYHVLSDPEKRKKYDQLGRDWQQYQQPEHGTGGSGTSGRSDPGSTGKNDRFKFESFDGDIPEDFFEMLFGHRYAGKSRESGTSKFQGQDIYADLDITLEEMFHGAGRVLELNGQTLNINIKPGIEDGKKLRFAGKGSPGINGGSAGDLFILIKQIPHHIFKRDGINLHCRLPVDLYTAMLGGKVELITLYGKIKVDLKKGTENGKILKLTRLGMPIHGQPGKLGDLYVEISISLPGNLSSEEENLFKKLQGMRPSYH